MLVEIWLNFSLTLKLCNFYCRLLNKFTYALISKIYFNNLIAKISDM